MISFFNGAFALYILLRNRKGAINRSFFAFIASVVFWVITIWGFLVVSDPNTAKFIMQLSYFSAILIALSFFHFANLFPFQQVHYHPLTKICLATSTLLITLIVFYPDYLIREVIVIDGVRSLIFNRLGHIVFTFYFLTFTLLIFYLFFMKYFQSDGLIKIQLKYVALGCLAALVWGVFFNLLLPAFGAFRWLWVGPYLTCAVTIFVGYTINLTQKIR